jgi:hypothetical protein
MHQVSFPYPHPCRDVAAQNPVEHIDIDLPELFLNRRRHSSILIKLI